MADQPIRRALLSVWDKAGLVDFARELAGMGVELVSTGGTASTLREAGLAVTDVASVTGAPGILDGRVKTLHPAVHGGILARRDVEAHMATIEALNIPPIDLVVVNLYPFEATVAEGAGYEATVEMIDVGGPAMIRAAAKNHASVTVVVEPEDYGPVLEAMRAHDRRTTPELRQRLAARRSGGPPRTMARSPAGSRQQGGELLPERLTITAKRAQLARYGENPHQRAAFYVTGEQRTRRGHGHAGPGQGAELQQHRRCRCGVRAGVRVRGPGGRDHQARQSLRRGARRRPGAGLRQGAGLRSDQRLRRHRGAQPAARAGGRRADRPRVHRGGDRARRRCRRARSAGGQAQSAPAADRRPAAERSRRAARALGRGRPARPGAGRRRSRRGSAPGRHGAAADRCGAGRSALCVRGVQARQVERHRVRQGRRHRRHRRRAR